MRLQSTLTASHRCMHTKSVCDSFALDDEGDGEEDVYGKQGRKKNLGHCNQGW